MWAAPAQSASQSSAFKRSEPPSRLSNCVKDEQRLYSLYTVQSDGQKKLLKGVQISESQTNGLDTKFRVDSIRRYHLCGEQAHAALPSAQFWNSDLRLSLQNSAERC